MARRTLAEIGAGRTTGHGFAGPVRQALLAICLAAAALAGDERPAGASQLCKAGNCSQGNRSDAWRPLKPRLLSEAAMEAMAPLVHPSTAE